VLDLGNRYVSNFVDAPNAKDWPRVPLEVVLCRKCSLLQLRHTTPPDWLYRRYWYKSGVNASMRAALADIAEKAARFVGLQPGENVLDIGCNDGTLLRSYKIPVVRRVGFEPAENLAAEARQDTDWILSDFFDARALKGERFKIITSIAMFYDLEDPNEFVAGVTRSLAEDGVWVIEMHYLPLMLSRNGFDAICHEHLEYYSLTSLEPLLERHGLRAADVETNEVNGGSFRIYAVHRDKRLGKTNAAGEHLEILREQERGLQLACSHAYEEFGARIQKIGERLRGFIERERAQQKQVSVYGASTKGNTLLQVFGLDHTLIRSAAERNPDKWGKYTVGTWIPIVSEALARADSDDFLVLPWHFIEEMRAREQGFLERGGKLIVPLPKPRVMDAVGVRQLE